MSCELSHMRFSNDIKDSLNVIDDKKYYQGVAYPDSRGLTGIKRNFTHDINQTKRVFFKEDDFKKGWASHVVYDIVHNKVMEELFEELFKKEDEKNNGYSSAARLAIKILQDLNDAKKFDFSKFLPLNEYTFSPQGESIELLNEYNKILYDSYKNSMNLTIDDYKKSLKKFEDKKSDSVDVIMEKIIEFHKSEKNRSKINNLYDISLEVYRKNFLL